MAEDSKQKSSKMPHKTSITLKPDNYKSEADEDKKKKRGKKDCKC